MPDFVKALIGSRRFWAAVASIIFVSIKDKLPLSEEQVTAIVMAIGAWIVGESLRSSNGDVTTQRRF
jgi:ribosomal protein L14